MKVAVLLSGGVDSSIAAYLMKEEGHDVVGVHLVNLQREEQKKAKEIAERLGIGFISFDLREEFRKEIINYFINEYKNGRTPNPCYFCNKKIKFGKLVESIWNDFDLIASGHYAIAENGKLYKAKKEKKDQSYFLASVEKNKLKKLYFPLGYMEKSEVLSLAEKIGIPYEKESQDVCFLKGKTLKDFMRENGLKLSKGSFVDRHGNKIGKHEGYYNYTIGQRRGLGISAGKRLYVYKIIPETNTVVLSCKEDVMYKYMEVSNLNFLEELPKQLEVTVKVRSNFREVGGFVKIKGGKAFVEFESKVFAVTPGQIAVFYINDQVVLSGVIERGYN